MIPMGIHIDYTCTFIVAEYKLEINEIIEILYKLMKDSLRVISIQQQ